jgi:hypothetical protein
MNMNIYKAMEKGERAAAMDLAAAEMKLAKLRREATAAAKTGFSVCAEELNRRSHKLALKIEAHLLDGGAL